MRKAKVAPILDANETVTSPTTRPKMPPANKVMIAPGSDNPATATYTTDRDGQRRVRVILRDDRGLLRLDVGEAEILAQIEDEECRDQYRDESKDDELLGLHGAVSIVSLGTRGPSKPSADSRRFRSRDLTGRKSHGHHAELKH